LRHSKVHKAPVDFPRSGLGAWLLAADGEAFCKRFATANKLYWRLPVSLSWDTGSGLYTVTDHDHETYTQDSVTSRIAIARRERVFRYRRGVDDRIRRLAKKYFVDRMTLNNGDVVVDCGANVGEIGLFAKAQADVRLIAIEPSTREAGACDANLFGGSQDTHRIALWHSEGTQTFYDSNATGDSSLIAPAQAHTSASTVRTTTLTKLSSELGVERIKLLKIEGEGAEPEILAGANDIMPNVDYCTVDCGPERGANQDHVIPQVCNNLIGAGFELLDVNLERQIFWFRNRSIV